MSPDPRRQPTRRFQGRSVVIAVILSLLIPGLGHVYIGRLGRALIWFLGGLAIGIILDQQGRLSPGSLIVLGVLGIAAAVDALVMLRFFQQDGPRR